MYVLAPYQTQQYEGWRTGQNRTNRFFFTGISNSYTANWGDYTAQGVIAVAVFKERRLQRIGKTNNRMGKSKSRKEAPGTGFGRSTWSPSREVQFVANNRPFEKQFIKYEWRDTLCQRGIIQCRQRNEPNRFWPEPEKDNGFAPFPSWYLHLRW